VVRAGAQEDIKRPNGRYRIVPHEFRGRHALVTHPARKGALTWADARVLTVRPVPGKPAR